jgi:uncharacterized protein
MPISPEFLALVCCPICKVAVELTPNSQGLRCPQCRRIYPIIDDLPVMLAEEARIEE